MLSRTQLAILVAVVITIVILASVESSIVLILIAILLATTGIVLYTRGPTPEVSLRIQDELYGLEPDRDRRERLLEIARVQYPGQPESWYWKKVIEDLRLEDKAGENRSWHWRRLVEDLRRNRR
jgi:hypothetical protein